MRHRKGATPRRRDETKLMRWLRMKPKKFLTHYRFAPKLILEQAAKDLQFEYITDERKIDMIGDYCRWVIEVLPDYRRTLKALKITNVQFGEMFGKPGPSWIAMPSREKYIRGCLAILKLYDKAMMETAERF